MVRLSSMLLASAISMSLASTILMPINTATASYTEEKSAVQDLPYKPSADQMGDVTTTLEKAKAQGKLALVVMGANWCHDSRALISKMTDPSLAPMLEENYETVLVDVGGLAHGKDVIERFGMPVIYGTPTLLVVDPTTGQQVNRHDMHQWRDAYSVSQEDTNAYFEKMLKAETRGAPKPDPESSELMALLAGVDAFEKAQSERIYKAFALIGPMITMKREERPDNFGGLWNELRDFRYQITSDLENLRADARSRIKAGETNIALAYPTYEPFSWEK